MLGAIRTWLVRHFLARLQTPRDVARWAFRRYAQRQAVVDAQGSLSYAELGDRTFRIAAAWRQQGVKPGDTVAVRLPDGIAQVEARLAAAECGAVLCLLAPWSSCDQLLAALPLVEPRLFVHDGADPVLCQALQKLLPDLPQRVLQAGVCDGLPPGPGKPCAGRIDPAATLSLAFTSGTTDTPKVMSATHGVYLTALRLMLDNVGVGKASAQPDTMLVGIPLTGAGSGVLLPTLLSGGRLVVPARCEAGCLIDCIEQHAVTRLFTTPSLLIDMLDHPDLVRASQGALRNIIYGTEMMPVAKLEEALRHFGPILQQGYGSAEVLPPVSMLQPHEHWVDGRPAPRATLMSCGRVVPKVTVRIVDEAGHDLPPGTPGEVLIKSPTLFRGYWKRPDLSAQHLVDGFLRIGDMGMLSAESYLTMLGRKPDLLQREGRRIFPRPVEEALHDHPAIKEASYVQGPRGTVMVFSLRRGWRARKCAAHWGRQLAKHLQGRVPDWQLPAAWQLLEDLPRSPLGKVLRREVRERLAEQTSGLAEGSGTLASKLSEATA
jgi:fatty-acyl-CoA synthase